MTDEKKDDFLSGHEELLNSIKKTDEPAIEAEETATEEPIIEPIEEVAPEPVIEEPITEELIEEPIKEEAPEPVIESESTIEEEQPIEEDEPVVEEEPLAEKEPQKTVPSKSSATKKTKNQPEMVKHPERSQTEKQRHDAVLKHQALEQSEVKEVLNFIRKYAKPTLIAVGAICALVIANSVFKSNRLNKEAKADAALSQALSAADYQAVLDDFGSTPSAPLALMGLAQEKFNAGQVDEADTLYGTFIKKYSDHELTTQAEFNQITCKEAKRQLDDAQRLYGEFSSTHQDSYLAPIALLSQARCFEEAGLFAKAKQVYEDLIAFYPESGWAQRAEMNLNVVESKLK